MILFRGIDYTSVTASGDSQNLFGTISPDWLATLGGDNVIDSKGGNDVILANVVVSGIRPYTAFGGEAIFYRLPLDANGQPVIANNVINSGAGDDYVAAGLGTNNVSLGSGNDIFDSASLLRSDVFPNIFSHNTVFAGSGDDIIFNRYFSSFGESTATVFAESGNDKASVSARNVFLDGGSGNDILLAGVSFGKLFVDGGSGNDTINAQSFFAQGEVKGGAGDDLIFGTDVKIDGGNGADSIATRSGDNLIHGGVGNDTIVSGSGNDVIYGDAGDDLINLRGASLTVSPEADSFFFNNPNDIFGGGNDTVFAAQGNDTIVLGLDARDPDTGDFLTNGVTTVFNYGVGDQLDLTGLGLTTGDVSLLQLGVNTSLSVGDDQVALLIGVQANTVIFDV